MNLLNTVSSLFNIRPGEGKSVSLMLFHSFFIGISLVYFETAAAALFLSRFDKSILPYFYIVAAIINVFVGFAYSRIKERVSFTNLMISTFLFLLILVGAFRLGLALTDMGWLLFGLLSCSGILLMLTTLEYWTVAGRLYDLRQGKRLFSLIGSGEVIAKIGGAFSVPLFVRLMGVKNLLLLSIAGLACSLGALIVILHAFPEKPSPHQSSRKNEKKEPPRSGWTQLLHLAKNRYLALMGLVTVFAIFSKFFIDFAFLVQVQTRYNDAAKLAGFFAIFSCVTQVIDFIGRIFLSGKIFSQYGIKVGSIVLPLFNIICTMLIVLAGTLFGAGGIVFWLTVTNQGIYKTLRYTLDKPSFKVLYQPLRKDQRLTAQIAIEGIVTPIALGMAGVIMLLFSTVIPYNPVHFSYVMLCALVIWIAFALRLAYKEYPIALMQALAKRNLGDTSLVSADSSTVAALLQGLNSPCMGVVMYSLNMLEEIEYKSLATVLQELLGHPEREVRLDVLQRIERLGMTSAVHAIRERLKYEGSAVVRGASLRVLAALGGSDMFDEVYAYLREPAPQIRRGVLVGLLRSGELEGILTAGEKLLDLVNSPESVEREFAAQVLGEAGIRGVYRPLLKLLHDDSPQVQRAALAAAGKLRHPKLWPLVTACLASPDVRTIAATALVAGGETVLPELQAAFTKEGQEREVLIRLGRIYGRIRGKDVIAFLRDHLDIPDMQVCSALLLALSQCGYQARDEERSGIRQYIRAEIAHAAWTLAALMDVGETEPVQLLKAALTTKFEQHRSRLFVWLAFLYDPQAILRARNYVIQTSPETSSSEKRAYALETIDVLVSSELKTILIPLLDNIEPAQRLQRLQAVFPQQHLDRQHRLNDLITGLNTWLSPWLRACTIYAVVRLSAVELADSVVLALSSPDPLVKETAVWALFRIDLVQYSQYVDKLAQDPSPQVVRAINQLETERKGGKVMLLTVEKVMLLKAANFFSETPEEILAEVASLLEEQDIQAGETILEQGAMNHAMYLVAEGQVRVHDAGGQPTDLGENDVFGELSLLDPGPNPASVTALTETRLLRLDQEPFYELLENHSTVARRVLQVLARQLRRTQMQTRSGKPRGDALSEIHEKLL